MINHTAKDPETNLFPGLLQYNWIWSGYLNSITCVLARLASILLYTNGLTPNEIGILPLTRVAAFKSASVTSDVSVINPTVVKAV